MTWRTCGSDRNSSARKAYSMRAVGFAAPEATAPRYCGASASSRISRSPRASLVAVPSDGIRSPRISREIVEWSTPDCWASWRWDIFLTLSCARSHSLNARPFVVVISARWTLRWATIGSLPNCPDDPTRPVASSSPIGTDRLLLERVAWRQCGVVRTDPVWGLNWYLWQPPAHTGAPTHNRWSAGDRRVRVPARPP